MNKAIGLYIHIPFCKQKCLYCDFPSFSGKDDLMKEYSIALSREIDKNSSLLYKSIFIGGGTPTYLSLNSWEIIKSSIDKLHKTDDLEFTIEANPGTLNKDILLLFKDMGVNRLSIGLQSCDNNILKTIGRIHNYSDFITAYEMAEKMGFNNINVDLMFGLPNQTMKQWKMTLNSIVKLAPKHISCYSLIVEEGTPFYNMQQSGKLNLPSEETEREMYHYAVNFLRENGYNQYEISNFAKENMECRHNIIYWEAKEYMGCGSGAHSFYNGERFSNKVKIEDYINSMRENNNAVDEIYKNLEKDNMEEFMFMGLRMTDGISIEEFHKRFNIDIFSIYGHIINKFINNSLLIMKNGRIFLSPEGIEVSNSVMCEFIL
ncbi:radical SAM family heme chaperone HemW [Clostridium sp. JN-9]|uniref:radical SAM family heme chaperone HemW n=1 Tax=Clostridium sp. JN-9 TaxID=2507159 RepID=UPI000FFE1218|nr:radical SAM family heme chaperone HemW [Clostridium sp. JN-9]QAT40775.1 oxygen-independent coproporphyrinogen III oxidase [Clostridium sp. JN-9]